MLHYLQGFFIPNLQERTGHETFSHFNRLTSTPGLSLHYHWNQWFFLGKIPFAFWPTDYFFLKSRVFQEPSVSPAASSMSMAGPLMQTITQNQLLPKYSRNHRSCQTGNGVGLFVFPSASLDPKRCSFAFGSSILFTPLFLAFMTIFSVRKGGCCPWSGSSIVGLSVLSQKLSPIVSIWSRVWRPGTQGSFFYDSDPSVWVALLGLIILIAVWKWSQTLPEWIWARKPVKVWGFLYSHLKNWPFFWWR